MIRFFLRRLPALFVTLMLTTVVAFLLPRMVPGDPAAAAAGSDARPEVVARIRSEMGLDKPLLTQYWDWISGVFRGDLGTSFATNRPVAELLSNRIASTLELAAFAGVLMIALGIGLGVANASATRRVTRVLLDGVSSVLLAAPPFLTGLFLIVIFGLTLPILPISGEVSLGENLYVGIQYLILPAFALALPQAAAISRLVDTSMRVTEREDFVDLARAKGVPRRGIISRHILRNSMGPALVTIGLRLGELLAGAIVIEAIFARKGLGSLVVSAVQTRDYFVFQIIVVCAVAIAVVMQLLTEIGVATLDPRIKLGAQR